MAIYECNKCGMSVKTSCAKCDEDLIDDVLKLDNGSEVQISKCPNNHENKITLILWGRYELYL